MLVGYPPFFSENPSDTCQKIVKWKQHFSIPLDANLSLEAENLIRKMVTTPEQRLGYSGPEEIKRHPFFKGFDWNNVRAINPTFIPDIKSDYDTKYFDTFPEQDPFYPPEKKQKKRKDINYPGYTYNRDLENTRGGILQAMEVLEAVKLSIQNSDEQQKIVDDLKESPCYDKSQNKKTSIEIKKSGTGSGSDNMKLPEKTNELNTINLPKTLVNSNSNKNLQIDPQNLLGNLKNSPSPDNLKVSKTIVSNNSKIPTSSNNSTGGKGLNIIPLKGLSSQRENTTTNNYYSTSNNDKISSDRLSPKPRDLKITSNNLSPNHKGKLVTSSKNVPQTNSNQGFDTSKYTNKIYTNIQSSLTNKSPSPKHSDTSKVVQKKSPESKK